MIEQHDTREEQIRKHHEKWKKWKIQLKMKESEKKKSIQERKTLVGKPEDNAREYARKLIQKLEEPDIKDCPISKNVADQLETNTCTICFQLMAPPSNPYILFPCGHNLCKICLFVNGNVQKAAYALRINQCPLCRVKISNYAQNRNLLKLICTYINKKDLLERELQNEAKQKKEVDNISKLTQHCELLESEKRILNEDLIQLKKNKKVLQQVIDRLLDERRRCRRQLDSLEDQSRLINRHTNDKQQEIDRVDQKINLLQEKHHSIESTLIPLKAHKEKLEMQQAKKIIEKK